MRKMLLTFLFLNKVFIFIAFVLVNIVASVFPVAGCRLDPYRYTFQTMYFLNLKYIVLLQLKDCSYILCFHQSLGSVRSYFALHLQVSAA